MFNITVQKTKKDGKIINVVPAATAAIVPATAPDRNAKATTAPAPEKPAAPALPAPAAAPKHYRYIDFFSIENTKTRGKDNPFYIQFAFLVACLETDRRNLAISDRIHATADTLTATDGYRLHQIPNPGLAPGCWDVLSKKGTIKMMPSKIERHYPDYTVITGKPVFKNSMHYTGQKNNSSSMSPLIFNIYKDTDQVFNFSYLQDIFKFQENFTCTLLGCDEADALHIFRAAGDTGKTAYIMPMTKM